MMIERGTKNQAISLFIKDFIRLNHHLPLPSLLIICPPTPYTQPKKNADDKVRIERVGP